MHVGPRTGTGAGNVATVTGAAKPATAVTPSRSDLVINASEAWDAANNTLVANDFVVFIQNGQTYSVQIGAGTTIQQYIDGVNAATGGRDHGLLQPVDRPLELPGERCNRDVPASRSKSTR